MPNSISFGHLSPSLAVLSDNSDPLCRPVLRPVSSYQQFLVTSVHHWNELLPDCSLSLCSITGDVAISLSISWGSITGLVASFTHFRLLRRCFPCWSENEEFASLNTTECSITGTASSTPCFSLRRCFPCGTSGGVASLSPTAGLITGLVAFLTSAYLLDVTI